jgi:hypothetical protein
MMAQQAKGFELVYDAASGLLPTECGFYQTDGSVNITDSGLMMTGAGTTARCEIGLYSNINIENRSVEIEITPIDSYFSFHSITAQTALNSYVTTDGYFSSVKPYSIHLFSEWEDFKKIVGYTPNSRLCMKTEIEGENTKFFLNDVLIYTGNYKRNATTSRFYINTEGQTLLHKITYKEW